MRINQRLRSEISQTASYMNIMYEHDRLFSACETVLKIIKESHHSPEITLDMIRFYLEKTIAISGQS